MGDLVSATASCCTSILPRAKRSANTICRRAPRGGPYAVTRRRCRQCVWANEINTDTVVRLDPARGEMRVVKLPSENEGIRKMIVDASGRLWYMGSHSGKLGVIE